MADRPPWTVDDVRALVRDGGAIAVAQEHLRRRARSGFTEAWITAPEADSLLERAREIDERRARRERLPLAGVPLAVKDNIDVAGVPTTAGCEPFAYVPDRSAPAVDALLDAGALFVGKTNLDQFATGLVGTRSPQYGACRNPHDAAYVAGGSSSGSAVVVATGEATLALGTDTAGSGRVPAANCGVVGWKPTPGAVPTVGVVPAMPSFDCVSVFGATVVDVAAADVLLRPEAPGGVGPVRRVGVPTVLEWFGDDDAPRCFDRALARLAALGIEVVEIDDAPLRDTGALLYGSALVAERAATFGDAVERLRDAVHPATREIVRAARGHRAEALVEATAAVRGFRALVDRCWDDVDAIVLPTVSRVPSLDEAERDLFGPSAELGRYTSFANPLGMPVVAVPAGMRASGLPFGVSIAGPHGSDDALLATGAAFEAGPGTDTPVLPRHERWLTLAVVGAHLSGQPLNHQLTDRGARLIGRTATAPAYRLYALDSTPPKPGLVRAAHGGASIEVEVWELDAPSLGAFVAAIPAPLGVGRVELDDGTHVSGFLCEQHAVEGALEITDHGGWRAYLDPGVRDAPRLHARSCG